MASMAAYLPHSFRTMATTQLPYGTASVRLIIGHSHSILCPQLSPDKPYAQLVCMVHKRNAPRSRDSQGTCCE